MQLSALENYLMASISVFGLSIMIHYGAKSLVC